MRSYMLKVFTLLQDWDLASSPLMLKISCKTLRGFTRSKNDNYWSLLRTTLDDPKQILVAQKRVIIALVITMFEYFTFSSRQAAIQGL